MKKALMTIVIATVFFTQTANAEITTQSSYAGRGYAGPVWINLVFPVPCLSYFPAEFVQIMLPVNIFTIVIPMGGGLYFSPGGLGFGVAGNGQPAYYINGLGGINIMTGVSLDSFSSFEDFREAARPHYDALVAQHGEIPGDMLESFSLYQAE